MLEDGSREVLTIVNYPTEGALCWKEVLNRLKGRGVEQIDLVVSDALQGIENAVCSAFPQAAHQFCVAHVKRQILNSVSHKDKPIVNQELNEVFTLENKERKSLQGYEHFITFVNQWEKKGSSVKWIDISHKLYIKKLVLCIFVVTKLQEHAYQHNAKRLRRLPTRLSESALRR